MDLNRGLPGETPITDISGLIPKHVRTVRDLGLVEIGNTVEAIAKYLSRKPTRRMAPFTRKWMLRVHKEMFGEVWSWAGQVRTTELNIGVAAYRVVPEMEGLAQDIAGWANHAADPMEQSARIHHRTVQIHPFLNGNGRWARLLGQIWQFQKMGFYAEWPEAQMWEEVSPLRGEYIGALKEADRGNLEPLLDLQQRFTPSP